MAYKLKFQLLSWHHKPPTPDLVLIKPQGILHSVHTDELTVLCFLPLFTLLSLLRIHFSYPFPWANASISQDLVQVKCLVTAPSFLRLCKIIPFHTCSCQCPCDTVLHLYIYLSVLSTTLYLRALPISCMPRIWEDLHTPLMDEQVNGIAGGAWHLLWVSPGSAGRLVQAAFVHQWKEDSGTSCTAALLWAEQQQREPTYRRRQTPRLLHTSLSFISYIILYMS